MVTASTTEVNWPAIPRGRALQAAERAVKVAADIGCDLDAIPAQESVRAAISPVVEDTVVYGIVGACYEFAWTLALSRRSLSPQRPKVSLTTEDLKDGLFIALMTADGDLVATAVAAWHQVRANIVGDARALSKASALDQARITEELQDARKRLSDTLRERIQSES